jgi:hypothetical protein
MDKKLFTEKIVQLSSSNGVPSQLSVKAQSASHAETIVIAPVQPAEASIFAARFRKGRRDGDGNGKDGGDLG